MKTVVIEVRGGVVQEVYAEDGTKIVLLDWDEYEEADSRTVASEMSPLPLSLMPGEAERLLGLES